MLTDLRLWRTYACLTLVGVSSLLQGSRAEGAEKQQEGCYVSSVDSRNGSAVLSQDGAARTLRGDEAIEPGDVIKTEGEARVDIMCWPNAMGEIRGDAKFRMEERAPDGSFSWTLFYGVLGVVRDAIFGSFDVIVRDETGSINARTRGTEFLFITDQSGSTTVRVLSGTVEVSTSSEAGKLVYAGTFVVVQPNSDVPAPQQNPVGDPATPITLDVQAESMQGVDVPEPPASIELPMLVVGPEVGNPGGDEQVNGTDELSQVVDTAVLVVFPR